MANKKVSPLTDTEIKKAQPKEKELYARIQFGHPAHLHLAN